MRKRRLAIFLLFCAMSFACGDSPVSDANANALAGANREASGGKAGDLNRTANNVSKLPANNESNDNNDFAGTAEITDKKNEIISAAILKEVRSARHEKFDRVVFEFAGAEMPSYHIEYIDKPARLCGSGNAVNLKGDGWLEIRFQPAAAHTEEGEATVKERELAPNHAIVKELKLTCDFEADVTLVLGVASPNPYRVLELKDPTRLAVDIKH